MACLRRPYHFTFFKGCLPQILLGPFLNVLPHLKPYQTSVKDVSCGNSYWLKAMRCELWIYGPFYMALERSNNTRTPLLADNVVLLVKTNQVMFDVVIWKQMLSLRLHSNNASLTKWYLLFEPDSPHVTFCLFFKTPFPSHPAPTCIISKKSDKHVLNRRRSCSI